MLYKEIKALLNTSESDVLEYKQSFNRDVIETAVAFANTRGGIILIGVTDLGQPIGTTLGKESLNEWTNEIAIKTEPTIIPEIAVEQIEGKIIIAIQITEYPIKPISTSGRCYRRVGNSNRRLMPKEIAELHLATTGSSWDALPAPGKTLDDIDLEKVGKYMRLSTAIGRRKFSVDMNLIDILKKLELVVDNKPTWASLLLFGKNPQSPLVQSTVHCGRFREEIHIMDDRLIDGAIYDQVEEVIDFLKKHMNVKFIIEGKARRDEVWDVPLEALREGVVNAICHRDYSDSADIQIKVFDDRIEIWSPGFLPFNLSIADLYQVSHPSKPRNKLIAQIFYDLALIERYGSGIQRMITACKHANLPDLDLKNFSGGFLLTFFKLKKGDTGEIAPKRTSETMADPVSDPVSDPVKKLIFTLKDGSLSSQKIRDKLGLKHRASFRRNYLDPALKAEIIEYTIPSKPNSRLQQYRLTEKGKKYLKI